MNNDTFINPINSEVAYGKVEEGKVIELHTAKSEVVNIEDLEDLINTPTETKMNKEVKDDLSDLPTGVGAASTLTNMLRKMDEDSEE